VHFSVLGVRQGPIQNPPDLFLTLTKFEVDPSNEAQVHFARPRGVKQAHVFRVLIHLDVVEDLLFFHYPRDELIADGKVSWRDFAWHFGRLDGELDDDEFLPPTRHCGLDEDRCWHPRDDEVEDRDQKHSRARGIMHRVSGWMEGHRRNKGRQIEETHGRRWYRGESSCGRNVAPHNSSPPPSCGDSPPKERRELRGLWQSFSKQEVAANSNTQPLQLMHYSNHAYTQRPQREQGRFPMNAESDDAQSLSYNTEAIFIVPQSQILDMKQPSHTRILPGRSSDTIIINHQPMPFAAMTVNPRSSVTNVSSLNMEQGQTSSASVYTKSHFGSGSFVTNSQHTSHMRLVTNAPIASELSQDGGTTNVDPIRKLPDGSLQSDVAQAGDFSIAVSANVMSGSQPHPLVSPQHIDKEIQDQGKEIHELLQLFKQANTEPLSSFILQTPKHKTTTATKPGSKESAQHVEQRKSPRRKKKPNQGKPILKMA
jgi:hypothetical protein